MRTLYAFLILAVIAGCATVAPQVQAGDTCYRCHRVIQDTKLAAEFIEQNDHIDTTYPFRTSGCMAKYLKVNPASKSTTLFVTDYRTGHMLEADSAWFVPLTLTSADGKKVEHDFAAFGSREDANAFRQDVPVRRWGQLLAEAIPD